MATRRKFLWSSLLGSTAIIPARGRAQAVAEKLVDNMVTGRGNPSGPIVISTWDFGKAAKAAAWDVLKAGGRSLDAVEAGVKVPEADPTNQSVGYGGLPDRDGIVTLDACIMDEKYNCGAVMALEHVTHAISVARLVMEKTPHIILAGEGAWQFAQANGFKKENLLTPESEKAWKEWLKTANYKPEPNIENRLYGNKANPMPGGPGNHDTIGMLAIDQAGGMSGACTTSGMAYKMHGRVGDSPVIGAGLYVDNEVGGATSTGVGEEVIRIAGSTLIVELMRHGLSPRDACKEGIQRIIKRNPGKAKTIQVGFLAMNMKGEFGAYCLQRGFTYAVKSNGEEKVYPAESVY